MGARLEWPAQYRWLHEYALSKENAAHEYKESWDAHLYRVHGKIFALLLRNAREGILLNLKCEPYLSLLFCSRHDCVTPGWHMNKVHWISLVFGKRPSDDLCRELLDISYDRVLSGVPRRLRGA